MVYLDTLSVKQVSQLILSSTSDFIILSRSSASTSNSIFTL